MGFGGYVSRSTQVVWDKDITEEAEGKGAGSRGSKPFLSARSEAEHGYEAPPFEGGSQYGSVKPKIPP